LNKKYVAFSIIAALGLLSACGVKKEEKEVKKEELTFGFFASTDDPERALKDLTKFTKELSKETELNIKPFIAMSYEDLSQKIKEGKVDIAFNGALPIVEIEKEIKVEPIAKATTHGKGSYHSEFIVKNDSSINSLEDLKKQKGAIWAYADETSTSGYLFPLGLLKKNGINEPKEYFTPVIAGGHDKAIVSVLTGNADFATVAEGVRQSLQKEYPDILEKTKVIGVTEEIPGQTIMLRSDLDKEVKKKIQDFMINKDKKRVALNYNAFKMEGFEKAKNEEYDGVRELVKYLNK